MDNENEMNKDTIELREASANEKPDADIKPTEGPVPAVQTVTSRKAASWGEKNVTRKFLSIALAVTLALNVVISAGIIKMLGPNRGFDNKGSGRPGIGQQFDNNRGGGNNMMPPSGNQQPGGQQNQQPDNQQNQQNDNQQSENQDSSSQEKA